MSGEVPWSQAPVEQQMGQIGSLFVMRDIEREVFSILDAMRSARLIYDEPRNAVFTGETGVGKSKLFSRYLAANPAERGSDGNIRRPVLLVDIRHSSSPKAVAQAILRALGVNDSLQKQSVTELTRQAKHHLVRQRVELVMVDEFHNTLTDSGNVREETRSNRIAEWVKDLCKTKTRTPDSPDGQLGENIPFAMIGTRKVLQIVDPVRNPELASITPYNLNIPRYRYGTPEEIEEFHTFLRKLDDELPFDDFSGLAEGEMPAKIHVASYGLMRQIHHLVTGAAELAVQEGDAGIREHHLFRTVERKRNILQANLLVDDDGEKRVVNNPFRRPELVADADAGRKRGWKAA